MSVFDFQIGDKVINRHHGDPKPLGVVTDYFRNRDVVCTFTLADGRMVQALYPPDHLRHYRNGVDRAVAIINSQEDLVTK